jgi:predicted lysophospholipase L1 biosynthesis ABC-type transport system permease subunit
MARFFFGSENPIGKHVWFDGDPPAYKIVGVVGDSKYMEAQEATPRTIYFNAFQEGRLFSQFSLRTSIPPEKVTGVVRAAVRDVLPTVPVDHMTTLSDQVDASMVPERLIVTLATVFGGLGLVLAAIGLYGLLAYTVGRRTNEIGIRMALGASRASVTGAVLGEALAMVAAGVLVGLPLAWWGRQFLAARLPAISAGIGPLLLGAMLITTVAAAAAYAPARRAARVDPMHALRQE